jgi:polynucleotide 5'-hydroxyl-kinase GRC3/NOL9
MHTQSSFHLSSLKPTTGAKWSQTPLHTNSPWQFAYQATPTHSQDFTGFLMLSEPLPPSQLATALNGSLVHIVETSDPSVQARFNELPRTSKWQLPYFAPDDAIHMSLPLDPAFSRLVCTALIHSFDPAARLVNILVPKTHEGVLSTLEAESTVLVAGCCDAPEWAYVEGVNHSHQQQLIDEEKMAPWVEDSGVMDGMGYLNVVRRVRKFLG